MVRQKETGLTTRKAQPGNYRKGPMDAISEGAMDTEASHIVAHERLDLFEAIDSQMDQHQETGYAFLKAVYKQSTDAYTRKGIANALIAFGQAERLEELNEGHVTDGHKAVIEARGSNHRVINIAEEHRRADAQAQQQERERASWA